MIKVVIYFNGDKDIDIYFSSIKISFKSPNVLPGKARNQVSPPIYTKTF